MQVDEMNLWGIEAKLRRLTCVQIVFGGLPVHIESYNFLASLYVAENLQPCSQSINKFFFFILLYFN